MFNYKEGKHKNNDQYVVVAQEVQREPCACSIFDARVGGVRHVHVEQLGMEAWHSRLRSSRPRPRACGRQWEREHVLKRLGHDEDVSCQECKSQWESKGDDDAPRFHATFFFFFFFSLISTTRPPRGARSTLLHAKLVGVALALPL